jgi:TolB protein
MNLRTGKTQRLTRARSIDWSPDWSPDGSKVAFASDRAGSLDVWVKDLRSGKLMRVTDDPSVDDYPSWSPDGARIAFASLRSGNWDIFTTAPGGTTAQRITADEAVDLFPVWSPDGTQLAFESDRDEGFFNIFRYVFDRAEERRVTRFRLGNASEPDWQRSRVAEVAVPARISPSRSTLRLI